MKLKLKGFSLIELMIVIAIIGILAAIAIPNYQNYVLKSKMGELLSGVSAAEMAVSEYIQSTGAADCSKMPIVEHQEGLYEYPDSTLIASITVDTDCNVSAVGADDQWGTEDIPIVTATATLSRKGTSFVCSTNVSFTPSTCPQAFP